MIARPAECTCTASELCDYCEDVVRDDWQRELDAEDAWNEWMAATDYRASLEDDARDPDLEPF